MDIRYIFEYQATNIHYTDMNIQFLWNEYIQYSYIFIHIFGSAFDMCAPPDTNIHFSNTRSLYPKILSFCLYHNCFKITNFNKVSCISKSVLHIKKILTYLKISPIFFEWLVSATFFPFFFQNLLFTGSAFIISGYEIFFQFKKHTRTVLSMFLFCLTNMIGLHFSYFMLTQGKINHCSKSWFGYP